MCYNGSGRTKFHIYQTAFCADVSHIELYPEVLNCSYTVEEHGTILQGTQNYSEKTLFDVSLKTSDDVVQRNSG
jgi:hypothetical protein